MPDPVLHLLAGPNGSGKSTLFDHVIAPSTHLELVNADLIAARTWPRDAEIRSYDAAVRAAARRNELMDARTSFVTETVFSHPSKVALVRAAADAGYLVTLHVVMVTEDLAVARVVNRVINGGHRVPQGKVRERYRRLWPLVVEAISITASATVYDNTSASQPFRVVARFERGQVIGVPVWPAWTPGALVDSTT